MNTRRESYAREDAEILDQTDRIVEYEVELMQAQGRPMLAAMFLFYCLVSVSMISFIVYWFF
jgi:hypothetical protein